MPTTDPSAPIAKHKSWALADARAQLDYFARSVHPEGGFHTLDLNGAALPNTLQELHTSTRMVHAFALAQISGLTNSGDIISHGLDYITSAHFDRKNGGFFWGVDHTGPVDTRKLAYGHVFVLLAGSSAYAAGHADGATVIDTATEVLNTRFWEDDAGLFADEWNADWTPFSTYRGMNANMHGVEALLAAYEATNDRSYLTKAGRILDFFMRKLAPAENHRLPEHFHADWSVDRDYSGNPMFRPAGTTPGHSFELSRLLIQYWELAGQLDDDSLALARAVGYQALNDAWDEKNGGIYYTLHHGGAPHIRDRYWWPVTEAIGFVAALLKTAPRAEDAVWYDKLWSFAKDHFVDPNGGWFPEIDDAGRPTQRQFIGKPDIYHALQAELLPLAPDASRYYEGLKVLRP